MNGMPASVTENPTAAAPYSVRKKALHLNSAWAGFVHHLILPIPIRIPIPQLSNSSDRSFFCYDGPLLAFSLSHNSRSRLLQ